MFVWYCCHQPIHLVRLVAWKLQLENIYIHLDIRDGVYRFLKTFVLLSMYSKNVFRRGVIVAFYLNLIECGLDCKQMYHKIVQPVVQISTYVRLQYLKEIFLKQLQDKKYWWEPKRLTFFCTEVHFPTGSK